MADSEKRRFGCLPIILFGALIVSVLFNVFLLLALVGSAVGTRAVPQFKEELAIEGVKGSKDKIALITLKGMIASEIEGDLGETMVEDLTRAFAQAVKDENVKSILFVIDSPGGEVTASDQIYHAVRQARDKKPVVVWMNSVAASGGYYAACGGSFLMAHDTTFTGSIGVIIMTLNYQELLGKVGLQAVVFKSGKFKDMLSGARPITPEEQAYVEGLIQEIYSRFVGIVAMERKLPEDQLRAGIADGRILSGKSALENKLIDATGQFEDAVKKARELGKAEGASVVRYSAAPGLGKLLRILGESRGTSLKIEMPASFDVMTRLLPGRCYLLPASLAGSGN